MHVIKDIYTIIVIRKVLCPFALLLLIIIYLHTAVASLISYVE